MFSVRNIIPKINSMKNSEMCLYVELKSSKTCVKWSLSKRPKIGFQDQLSLNAGQKYYRRGAFCNTFDLL